jgi:hypothetical protein
MIALLHARDTLTDFNHNASTFMAKHHWKEPFWVVARQRKGIGVTDASVGYFYKHFASAWRRNINFDDFKRFTRGKGDGGT